MNTCAEAVETAIKAARRWAYRCKGVPEDRAEIIVCAGNFHGRTTTIVGFSSEPAYRDGFGPFAPGFITIPYGDADALEQAMTPYTAAFLVEPIQGEAGIRVPPAGWLARCAELCRRHGILLIADEVQTGLAGTGRLLACEHEGVRPDGLILGKALGGGLVPVSLFLARADVMAVFTPGSHGSTFGGNPLACAVGLAALELIVALDLPARAERLGRRLMQGLAALALPTIRDVRGRGLLVGVELQGVDAERVSLRLLDLGLLTRAVHGHTLRLAPALIISDAEIDLAIRRLRRALAVAA